mmetsp:Transcript_30396/g.52217  ORF Transcript_30396/g.52217 Transcript_30396/m.52217 type:complete len:269 (-) Transcript_30396:36-842(-)
MKLLVPFTAAMLSGADAFVLSGTSFPRLSELRRGATTTAPPATESTGTDVILSDQDEAELLAASSFPIKPDKLIDLCKGVIRAQRDGLQDGTLDESIFADDFRFCAPFVGGRTPRPGMNDPMPGLDKTMYLSSLRSFDLLAAFPDMNNRYHAFRVDPFEPNRVWFQTRATATHSGSLMGQPPTDRVLELPPQMFSMTFNEQGQVTVFNVGNVIDRTVGNTGGLGGAFGFFYGVGQPLPFPECQPFEPSPQFKLLGVLQGLLKLLPQEK